MQLPLQASVMDHLCAHIPPFFKERNSLESSHGTRQQPIKSPHEVHTHEKKTPNLFESRYTYYIVVFIVKMTILGSHHGTCKLYTLMREKKIGKSNPLSFPSSSRISLFRETMETRLKSCYDRFRQLKIDYSWKMREEIEERTRLLCA